MTTLVIAAQEQRRRRREQLETVQMQHALETEIAPIDVIAQKEIGRLDGLATHLK